MKSEVRREKSSSDIGKAVKKESGYPKRKIILISSIVSGILLLIVLIIMIILLVSCPGLFFTQHGHVTNRERTSPATQTSTKTAEIKPSSVKWTAPQTDIEDERNEDGSCKYIEIMDLNREISRKSKINDFSKEKYGRAIEEELVRNGNYDDWINDKFLAAGGSTDAHKFINTLMIKARNGEEILIKHLTGGEGKNALNDPKILMNLISQCFGLKEEANLAKQKIEMITEGLSLSEKNEYLGQLLHSLRFSSFEDLRQHKKHHFDKLDTKNSFFNLKESFPDDYQELKINTDRKSYPWQFSRRILRLVLGVMAYSPDIFPPKNSLSRRAAANVLTGVESNWNLAIIAVNKMLKNPEEPILTVETIQESLN